MAVACFIHDASWISSRSSSDSRSTPRESFPIPIGATGGTGVSAVPRPNVSLTCPAKPPHEKHQPSPIVELNRGVAVAMASGPAAGLAVIDRLSEEPLLRHYHLLPAVRADLCARLERFAEAQSEFERAASLAQNERERALLRQRAMDCAARAGSSVNT